MNNATFMPRPVSIPPTLSLNVTPRLASFTSGRRNTYPGIFRTAIPWTFLSIGHGNLCRCSATSSPRNKGSLRASGRGAGSTKDKTTKEEWVVRKIFRNGRRSLSSSSLGGRPSLATSYLQDLQGRGCAACATGLADAADGPELGWMSGVDPFMRATMSSHVNAMAAP